jgi:transcriptional regulator with XRE-family HTH domain
MQERGVSYRILASHTDLSAGYLNHLVHGNRPVPSNHVIEVIAAALDVDPASFREYRLHIVTERLAALPELVDQLYRETAPPG